MTSSRVRRKAHPPCVTPPTVLTDRTTLLVALPPQVLRKLYSVGDDDVGVNASNKQAVTAFLEQYYSAADQAEFNLLFSRTNRGRKLALRGDATSGSLAGTESMLDTEYITAMGAHIPTEFWGFKGRAPGEPENEPFLKWLQLVSNTSDAIVPKVLST